MGKVKFTKLAAPVSVVMLLNCVPAYAEPPTNDQLFNMLQDMQSKIGALQEENSVLKKELKSVKSSANAANPGQARVTAATTKLYGALTEFLQEIDPNMEGNPDIGGRSTMGAMPSMTAMPKVQANQTQAPPQTAEQVAKLLTPRNHKDYKLSLGTTGYFVLGETFAWAKAGSYQSGVQPGAASTSYVEHYLVPSIEAALEYRLSDSSWRINTYASYLRNKTEPESLTVNNNYVPAFSASDLRVDIGTMRASSELERFRVGVDGRYALMDTKYNSLDVDLGLNFGSIDHTLNINAPVSGLVNNNMKFFGAGPRLGIAGRHQFKNGLGFTGGLGTTLLTGYGTLQQQNPNQGSTSSSVRITEEDWRVVPMVDVKIASTFNDDSGSYALGGEFGLKAEYWSNLPDWYSHTHYTVNPSKSGADNMTFLGPYLEFNAKF